MRKSISPCLLALAIGLAGPAAADGWLGGGNPPPDAAAGGKEGINAGGGNAPGNTTGGATTGSGGASGGGLGAPAADAAALMGAWTCTFTDPTDPSTDGSTAAVAYLPGGTSTADAVFLIPGAVGQDRLFMKVTGTWVLAGQTLTETMTGFEIVAYEQAGQRIEFAMLPPEIQAAFAEGLTSMVGVSAVSDITALDAARLVVRDQATGAVSDCTRG